MGLVSSTLGVLGFAIVGLPLGLVIGFFLFVYSKPKDGQESEATPILELHTNDLQSILTEIPNWIKFPDHERVDWLNKFLLHFWPFLDKAICDSIRSTIQPMFADYIGKYQIQEINFGNLSLGTLPPTFHGMKVYETNENELVMETSVKWAGNPNIVLLVKLFSLPITIQLVELQVYATPRIHLKPLVPTFPCFSNIVVSLMEKPHVDFGLNILGGDIMSIPGLYQFVQDTIKKQVANLYVWPQFLEISVLDNSTSSSTKKPIGVLHVKVVRASNLLAMDISGTSDPYVTLSLTGDKKISANRTSTKKRNLNPEWNEEFMLTVKDLETQSLDIQVYDWDKVGGDDLLGVQAIPLKELTPNETKEIAIHLLKNFDMNDPHNSKPRGKLVLELTFNPSKHDQTESFKHINTDESESISRKRASSLGAVMEEDDDHEPSSTEGGVLLVTVIEAEGVEGEHHTNPYAQVLFRGEKRKTQIIKKNSKPRWDESFEFMCEEAPLREKLHVEIFSKNSHRMSFQIRKESLGYVDIALADVIQNGRVNEKYNLINSKNGVIQVEIQWL